MCAWYPRHVGRALAGALGRDYGHSRVVRQPLFPVSLGGRVRARVGLHAPGDEAAKPGAAAALPRSVGYCCVGRQMKVWRDANERRGRDWGKEGAWRSAGGRITALSFLEHSHAFASASSDGSLHLCKYGSLPHNLDERGATLTGRGGRMAHIPFVRKGGGAVPAEDVGRRQAAAAAVHAAGGGAKVHAPSGAHRGARAPGDQYVATSAPDALRSEPRC